MNDIVFISYPKSGRTWILKIFEKYEAFSKRKSDRLIRTHLGYGGNEDSKLAKIKNLNSPKYVLLTRNIPDTLVSYYHDEKVRKWRGGAKGTIDEFVIEYKPHIDKFYEEISEYDFSYEFSYENMQSNPIETILPFAEMIYDEVSLWHLQEAVDFCEFSNLSKLERERKEDMKVNTAHMNNNFFKTRKGRVGSAQEELKPETLKKLL